MSRPHCPIPPALPLSARFLDSARTGFNAGIGAFVTVTAQGARRAIGQVVEAASRRAEATG